MIPWRVLFLDVDGVLNHSACDWNVTHRVLDPDCVRRVRDVCRQTGARIVVSSVWRLSREGMEPILAAFDGLIIGVTPSLPGGLNNRSLEIAKWLAVHAAIPMEVCVIDDEADAECKPLPFVRTSFEQGGFTRVQEREVLAAFGGGAPA